MEISEKSKADFETLMKGKICAEIGKVTKNPKLIAYGLDGAVVVDAALTDLRRSWKKTLSSGV